MSKRKRSVETLNKGRMYTLYHEPVESGSVGFFSSEINYKCVDNTNWNAKIDFTKNYFFHTRQDGHAPHGDDHLDYQGSKLDYGYSMYLQDHENFKCFWHKPRQGCKSENGPHHNPFVYYNQ